MKDLIERLKERSEDRATHDERLIAEAADLLERIYSQPVKLPNAGIRARYSNDGYPEAYTADQLTQAVQEATARAQVPAAKECEELGTKSIDYFSYASFANAIRNLIGRVK